MRPKTGFEKYFETRMKDQTFASEYAKARAKIDATDTLIRALEGARQRAGMSKAELARKTNTSPVMIRRLLTADDANPTLDTVLKLVTAFDCHLELVPNRAEQSGRRSVNRRVAAKRVRKL